MANDRLQIEWKVIKKVNIERLQASILCWILRRALFHVTVAYFQRWVHWLWLECGGVAKWGLRNFLQDWDWGSFWIISPQRDKVDPEGCAKWGAFSLVSLAGETNDWGSKDSPDLEIMQPEISATSPHKIETQKWSPGRKLYVRFSHMFIIFNFARDSHLLPGQWEVCSSTAELGHLGWSGGCQPSYRAGVGSWNTKTKAYQIHTLLKFGDSCFCFNKYLIWMTFLFQHE